MVVSIDSTSRLRLVHNVALKVGVIAGLLGREPAGRVVHQHQLKQIKTDVIEIVAKRLTLVPLPFREGGLEVGV